MIEVTVKRLEYLCTIIPPLLAEIDEKQFSTKPAPFKWSKKEILGHLIDSATNNHQRFVRAQFEDCPLISYDQDKWNMYSYYQQIDKEQLIGFWTCYNLQLACLINCIPEAHLQKECMSGNGKKLTLTFLISDYLSHLEHHLRQVVTYV